MDFTEATKRCIEQADYLTDAELPFVATLQRIAKALDEQDGSRLSASLLSEYMKATKYLLERKPPATPEIGAIEKFLEAHAV